MGNYGRQILLFLQVLYLFFHCPFTKRVWKSIISLWLLSDPKVSWQDLVDWSVIHLKGKGLRAVLCN